MKVCLHNKVGQEPTPGSSIKLGGSGNCFRCVRNGKNNDCKLFYPITIVEMEVEDGKR